ncbi:hypothetical protein V6M85_07285 [Sulfolobus tengchongensis]|uniref:Uncharacterized protein n=1 Tax=Sulfolobus tengchongensis TaxID=207809 RepID=A0AAX4KWQ3_9CREN
MLLPILIATLSIGLIEGLDPYKGLLFSYYFHAFNKIRESYLIPILTALTYYLVGTLAVLTINVNYNGLTGTLIASLLITHILIKILMGKILHYPGNMRPRIINVIVWSLVNSIIQMNMIVLLALSLFSKLNLVLIILTAIISRESIFLISIKYNRKILLTLTNYNFDYFYSIVIAFLCVVIILPLL